MTSSRRTFRASFASCTRTMLGVATAMLFCAVTAHAQWRVGGFVGGEHESSWDEFLVIGADARGVVGAQGLEINPRFSYFVRSGETRYQADINLIKPLVLATPYRVQPFVGTGLAVARFSFDGAGGSETKVGFNYIVGGTLRTSGRLIPFAQFEYTVLNDAPNNAVISAGLHFALGGSAKPAATPAPKPVRR
ncbi:MAG: hypothetical protein H7099_11500 [Gemmatimonadaceae bacterium]|nr:hypothetical protein [Gemmatimonadaceae bacterium]